MCVSTPLRRRLQRCFSLLVLLFFTAAVQAGEQVTPESERAIALASACVVAADTPSSADARALRKAAVAHRQDDAIDPARIDETRQRVEQAIAAKLPPVSDAAVETAVQALQHARQGRIRLRHIFKRIPRQATAQEKARARADMEGYLAAIDQGQDIAKLATAYSDSESAPRGGLVGWVGRDKIEPALADQLWALEPGQHTGIVETPVGLQIFQIVGREPEESSKVVDRKQVREQLTLAAQRDAYRSFLLQRAATLRLRMHADRLEPPLDDRKTVLDSPLMPLKLGALLARWNALDFIPRRETALSDLLHAELERRVLALESRCAAIADQRSDPRDGQVRPDPSQKQAAQVSEETLRQYYAIHPELGQEPEQRRLRAILMRIGDRSPHRVYNDLDALVRKIRSGSTDLSVAARATSQDASSVDDGEWGWIDTKSLALWAGTRFADAIASASEGALLGPLMVEVYDAAQFTYTPRAFALVRVEAIRPAGKRSFEDVRALVLREYTRQQQAPHK